MKPDDDASLHTGGGAVTMDSVSVHGDPRFEALDAGDRGMAEGGDGAAAFASARSSAPAADSELVSVGGAAVADPDYGDSEPPVLHSPPPSEQDSSFRHDDREIYVAGMSTVAEHWTEQSCPPPLDPLPRNTTAQAGFLLAVAITMLVTGIAYGELGIFCVGILPCIPGVWKGHQLYEEWAAARRRRRPSSVVNSRGRGGAARSARTDTYDRL